MNPSTTLLPRDVPPRVAFALEQAGVHPLLARLLAGRGVREASELDDGLHHLLPPATLHGAAAAGELLADLITQGQRLCVVADYDCDGATACAVALRGLGLLGALPQNLSYVVPDRAVHGYGLTPAIVDLATRHQPHLLVTVDNGIASHAGVAHARAQGLRVLVTDHHLPALVDGVVSLPDADVIVNPNQPACGFASKCIAGVGVMFYVLLATRAVLRERGQFAGRPEPRLDSLLDLVALGTVADVVKLDANNRRLVAQGLKRIRSGRMQPGVRALFEVAARDSGKAAAFDFGFALGPRINAAGRLSDMTLGIECLRSDDAEHCSALARQLDAINRERRVVESGMREVAQAALERWWPAFAGGSGHGAPSASALAAARSPATGAPSAASASPVPALPAALVVFDETFHEGVVGIVAGRLKDRAHRPTFVMARGLDGALKGSGRSIPGFHLRDALDLLSKRHPGVLLRFGGHAMAAGCTVGADALPVFTQGLQQIASEWLDATTLTRTVRTDGPLQLQWFNTQTAALLDQQVWGQGFEVPTFCDEVKVLQQRLVADKHLKLRVLHQGTTRDAIWFNHTDPVPETVRLAWRLSLDEWNGQQRVQMLVEAAG